MSHLIRFNRNYSGWSWRFGRKRMAVSGLLLMLNAARAQDVITSPPPTPAVPAAVQEVQNNNPMQVFAPSPESPDSIPLQWGPITLHPHVDYQISYGNGIQAAPGQAHNTMINQVSPGILFILGDHWTLDYTPTLIYYSSSSFKNALNQAVNLGWGAAYGGDWFFHGSQSYTSTSNPQVQTGAQTDTENFGTALSASYQFNEKMSLDMGLNQNLNYVGYTDNSANQPANLLPFQRLGDSQAWSTMEWLNYGFWPRLNAGVGVGFGYTQQENSPDSINEQYQGRVNWRATDKISFQLSGGLQNQQYLSGRADSLLEPVFSGQIRYQLFEQTRLTVSASRTMAPSDYQNQTSVGTSIGAGLNQRLLGRLNLSLSGAYSTTEFISTATGLGTRRTDDLYSFTARLSCPVLKRGAVSVFYSYSDNTSSQSGFVPTGSGYGYTSNQGGLELSYQY